MGKGKHHKKSKGKKGGSAEPSSTAAALAGLVLNDRYHPSALLDDIEEGPSNGRQEKLSKKFYEKELERLQVELVKMQYWIKHTGFRMILLFEGRDAAGKGGTIKRITEPMNPRGCKVVALGTPSDQQKT